MKSHELHPPERGSETILFAEDDEHVRRLSSDILAQAGYTVIQACDGQEAVQLLREHCAEIDLLLLDVVMPSLGGREICEQAQDICPGVPTLFTSGYDESSIHKDFILREGMALLEKPYSMRSLLKRIRAVLDS
jgi:DNA-binding response OmpR family regulator